MCIHIFDKHQTKTKKSKSGICELSVKKSYCVTMLKEHPKAFKNKSIINYYCLTRLFFLNKSEQHSSISEIFHIKCTAPSLSLVQIYNDENNTE